MICRYSLPVRYVDRACGRRPPRSSRTGARRAAGRCGTTHNRACTAGLRSRNHPGVRVDTPAECRRNLFPQEVIPAGRMRRRGAAPSREYCRRDGTQRIPGTAAQRPRRFIARAPFTSPPPDNLRDESVVPERRSSEFVSYHSPATTEDERGIEPVVQPDRVAISIQRHAVKGCCRIRMNQQTSRFRSIAKLVCACYGSTRTPPDPPEDGIRLPFRSRQFNGRCNSHRRHRLVSGFGNNLDRMPAGSKSVPRSG